jgi:hypothetical protein
MKRWRLALLAGALGGCITIKPFTGNTDVSATMDGAGGAVTAPGYAVHFSKTLFPYPDSVTIGQSANLLRPGNMCFDEDLVGIAMFPNINAAPRSRVTPLSASLNIDVAGSAVAKVGIDWSAKLACMATSGTASGRSTFTFFADGRVDRADSITLPNGLDAATCGCQNGLSNTWFLTSFMTVFRPTTLVGVAMIPMDNNPGDTALSQAVCADDGLGHQLAAGPFNGMFRVRSTDGTSNVVFTEDHQPMPTTLSGETVALRSQWRLEAGQSCTDVQTRLMNDLVDAQLDLNANGTFSNTGRAPDGIFGGEDVTGTGILSSDTVLVRAPVGLPAVPAGSALWLRFNGPRSSFSVLPLMPSAYITQQPAPDQVVIWFRDPIDSQLMITAS